MYCPSCGTANPDGAAFCTRCGKPLSQTTEQARWAPSPAALETASDPLQSGPLPYSGFWRRVGAYFIDAIALFAAAMLIGLPFGLKFFPSGLGVYQFVQLIGGWLYFALMESSVQQGTLGKMALGIKVTTLSGERIGFGRATGRYFAKFLSSLILSIGYLMVAFTSRRQGLHDMIAGTLIVKRAAASDEIARAGPAPRVSGWAIAGIVAVFAFVPIVGILAAIAIPAYQDYTIRAQVSEGLYRADSVKARIAERYAQTGMFAGIDNAALQLPNDTGGKYVEAIHVENGVVSIEYGRTANNLISAHSLLLVPGTTENGAMVWVCGRSPPPDNASMAIEDYAHLTTIAAKYLPSSCR